MKLVNELFCLYKQYLEINSKFFFFCCFKYFICLICHLGVRQLRAQQYDVQLYAMTHQNPNKLQTRWQAGYKSHKIRNENVHKLLACIRRATYKQNTNWFLTKNKCSTRLIIDSKCYLIFSFFFSHYFALALSDESVCFVFLILSSNNFLFNLNSPFI